MRSLLFMYTPSFFFLGDKPWCICCRDDTLKKCYKAHSTVYFSTLPEKGRGTDVRREPNTEPHRGETNHTHDYQVWIRIRWYHLNPLKVETLHFFIWINHNHSKTGSWDWRGFDWLPTWTGRLLRHDDHCSKELHNQRGYAHYIQSTIKAFTYPFLAKLFYSNWS